MSRDNSYDIPFKYKRDATLVWLVAGQTSGLSMLVSQIISRAQAPTMPFASVPSNESRHPWCICADEQVDIYLYPWCLPQFLLCLAFNFWSQGLPLGLELAVYLDWPTNEPLGSVCLHSLPSWSYWHKLSCLLLHGWLGSKLGPPGLVSRCSAHLYSLLMIIIMSLPIFY